MRPISGATAANAAPGKASTTAVALTTPRMLPSWTGSATTGIGGSDSVSLGALRRQAAEPATRRKNAQSTCEGDGGMTVHHTIGDLAIGDLAIGWRSFDC